MFDDKTATQPVPPSNLPVEPPDMFDGVDKDAEGAEAGGAPQAVALPDALAAGLLKKKESGMTGMYKGEPSLQQETAPPVYAVKAPVLGKVLLGVGVVVILAGIGMGGWWLYGKYLSKNVPAVHDYVVLPPDFEDSSPLPKNESLTPASESVQDVTATATTDASAGMTNDSILFGEAVDADGDALDDIRERELGTNIEQSDTDGDGLTDGDEVIIWKTNPLNSDTDGDRYVDGEEVRNGYDPKGPGRLFNVPTSTTNQ